jgi:hypothetical protein
VRYLDDGRDIVVRFAGGGRVASGDSGAFTIGIARNRQPVWKAVYTEVRRNTGGLPKLSSVCVRSQMLQDVQARLQAVAMYLFEGSRNDRRPPWEGGYYGRAEVLQAREAGVQRKMLAYNAHAALAKGDIAGLRETLGVYKGLVLDTPLLDKSVVAESIESIVWYCFWVKRDELAWEIMSGPLLECYTSMDGYQLRRNIGRLVGQARYGAALLALHAYSEACDTPPSWVESLGSRLKSTIMNGFCPKDAILYPQLIRQAPIDRKIAERLAALESSAGR